MEPRIQYLKTSDGVDIAYAVVGDGPPLLVARGLLMPGLDDDIARPSLLWPALTESHSVVLWDNRGVGLSGSAPEAGFDDWLADMDAVANAVGAGRFDLVGMRTSSALVIAYAARQPSRVDRLALYRAAALASSLRRLQPAWLFALASDNWHDFVDILALREYGWDRAGLAERWANQLRAHFTAAQFLHLMDVMESIDTTRDAGHISTPTLVIDDRVTPMFPAVREVALQQFARQIAAAIPGAQLVIIKAGDAPVEQVVERFLSGSSGAVETRHEASTPSGTAVILFADIVDSTALTETMGDKAFRDKARTLDETMRRIIREHAGTPVEGKLLGDGVLAVFTSAQQAIEAAMACGRAGDDGGLPLHLGLHAGDVIREENNVYGGAVNIASRISGLSAPGEVLVSETVRSLARTSAGVGFEERGEQALKGVGEPVRVWAVRPFDSPSADAAGGSG